MRDKPYASTDADITKLSAALTLLKSTSEKAGTTAQAAVQSGVGLYTFIWGKVGSHMEAVKAGTVRILAKSSGSASSSDMMLTRPSRPCGGDRVLGLAAFCQGSALE